MLHKISNNYLSTIKDSPCEVKMFMAARHLVKYSVNLKEVKERLLSNSTLSDTEKTLRRKEDHEMFVRSLRAMGLYTGFKIRASGIVQLAKDHFCFLMKILITLN